MKQILSAVFMIAVLATMAVVAAIDVVPDAEAFQKGKGVSNSKYGSATKTIVCGDMLCSEKHESEVSSMKVAKSSTPQTPQTPQTSSKPNLISSTLGATVLSSTIDSQSDQITISINAYNDGKITLELPSIMTEIYMVLVDGEEWDSAYIDGNKADVYFYAGTEKIEIIGNILG